MKRQPLKVLSLYMLLLIAIYTIVVIPPGHLTIAIAGWGFLMCIYGSVLGALFDPLNVNNQSGDSDE